MKPDKDDLLQLLRLLGITEVHEIDCAEFLHRAAGYAERMRDAAPPQASDAEVVHHLHVCPECLEEYEALYRMLRNEA